MKIYITVITDNLNDDGKQLVIKSMFEGDMPIKSALNYMAERIKDEHGYLTESVSDDRAREGGTAKREMSFTELCWFHCQDCPFSD